MKKYKTTFNRFHSGKEWQEQNVEIVVETDIPFDDENLEEFEQLFWNKLFELYPDWGKGLPKINDRGWSSALSSGRFTLVD